MKPAPPVTRYEAIGAASRRTESGRSGGSHPDLPSVSITSQQSRKPNSVPAGAPHGPPASDDHSSRLAIAGEVQRPTRRLGRAVRSARSRRSRAAGAPPYLVLLRAGFGLPPTLRPARCALTAPFHPYSPPPRAKAGGMFSVPLSFRSP